MKYDQFNNSPWGGHERIVDLIGSDKIVLDIGCATGLLSKAIKENRNTVYGIDISKEHAEAAKSICTDVYVGDIENMEVTIFSKRKFDVIIFADVLEHLKDPNGILRKFRPILKDDGFVIISLPNIANIYIRMKLLLGNFEYENTGIMDRSHLRFFTYSSAKRLIIDSGYKIKESYITIPNYPRNLSLDKRFSLIYNFFFKLANLWKSGLAFQFIFKVYK